MRTCTAEEFLKDVATHQMAVLLNSGIYRHLKFRAEKNGWNQWFEIITWPGHLTLSGDMGTWTFARVEDMFTFFRSSELKINEGYWAEKLQGGDSYGGRLAMQFDVDVFRKHLFQQLKSSDLTSRQRGFVGRELREALEFVDENEYALHQEVYEFHCEVPGYGRFEFDGADLPSGRIYTYRFVWCLYAIVWGIQQFDKAAAVPAPPHEEFYIQNIGFCGNSLRWWGPNRGGYVSDLDSAGRYSREEAQSIVSCRKGQDFMYPCAFVDSLSERHITDIEALLDYDRKTQEVADGR